MANKYYAVKCGRVRGIFYSWEDCKQMTDNFPGAVYKSFPDVASADAFLGGAADGGEESAEMPENYAFVDGSYNVATKVYGYGGFLVHGGIREVLQGSGDEPGMAAMHNVAGEISGCMAAVGRALALGLSDLAVYYDYLGIEKWATGAWKRNKPETAAYYDYMKAAGEKIAITFVKVKGHSGVAGNEEADRLAKEAAGI